MSMMRNWALEAQTKLAKENKGKLLELDDPKVLQLADKMARAATDIDCSGDEVRTKQEFKDDADINVIVARCVKDPNTVAVYAPKVAPVFADVANVVDFQASMERMAAVEDAFMTLPPKVREFFGNDPWAVVPFVQDPKNLEKAVELGVAIRPAAPAAPAAPAPAPAAPAAPAA